MHGPSQEGPLPQLWTRAPKPGGQDQYAGDPLRAPAPQEGNQGWPVWGEERISALDLLAGSHASILSNFYERALADQPAAVRRIIEDDLLTDSGFRENVAMMSDTMPMAGRIMM